MAEIIEDRAQDTAQALLPLLGIGADARARWADDGLRGAAALGWVLHFVEWPTDINAASLPFAEVCDRVHWQGEGFGRALRSALRSRALMALSAAVVGARGMVTVYLTEFAAEALGKLLRVDRLEGDPLDLAYGHAREADGAAEACALLAVIARNAPAKADLVRVRARTRGRGDGADGGRGTAVLPARRPECGV